MTTFNLITKRINRFYRAIKFHLFETDDVFIYWPDYYKGILLLIFALMILPGHLLWYVVQYSSENKIWFNESYHDYRIFTTWCQILLTLTLLAIALVFKKIKKFRLFMGWFIPLYFGLLLIYSAYTVGLYSPAAMGGILNILLIGFVFYKPKIIYSIMVIISIVLFMMCYYTSTGELRYAPLFSERLNSSEIYKNHFWLQSMAILYLPILVISAFFFEVLLRQWRRRENKIETLSQVDSLTNVFNRRYTNQYISHLRSKQNTSYAMVILDLDYFKRINDTYGHDAGDEVLKCVAKILKDNVRDKDIVGRLGGEEFVLILPNQNLHQALEISERCRSVIEKQEIQISDNKSLKVTASFGVAVAESHMTMDDVARIADRSLYISKNKGRNCVSHYLEVN